MKPKWLLKCCVQCVQMVFCHHKLQSLLSAALFDFFPLVAVTEVPPLCSISISPTAASILDPQWGEKEEGHFQPHSQNKKYSIFSPVSYLMTKTKYKL